MWRQNRTASVVQSFRAELDLCGKAELGSISLAMVNLIPIRMRTFSAILVLLSTLAAPAATLTVDPAQSHISLTGSVVGNNLREQGAGSLSTTVGGTISVTVAGGQIQIDSANFDPNVN